MMTTEKHTKQLQNKLLIKKSLDWSKKRLTLSRVNALVNVLSQSHCMLKTLKLDRCRILETERDEVLSLLADGLKSNRSLTDISLIMDFPFSEKASANIVKALQLNTSITTFNFNLKRLNSQLINTISTSLQDNIVLRERNTTYTPQFFKVSPVNSRKNSIENMKLTLISANGIK